MEVDFSSAYMLESAGEALWIILAPERLMFLCVGVLVGLAIGILPGIGGLTGFALLVPFTYTMDPFAAIAMLLGMHSVTSTSDTIPAVLFGVPGTSSSQATVLDGLPMTKKGEAGRALSAGYSASLFGGIIGAIILAAALPVIRPFVLAVGSPELLALTFFGIAMVSSLSGNAPLRGIIAACFGVLIGMVGTDVQTGTLRWAGDVLYLWDGIPILPVLLGVFAIPELCDLAVQRSSLAKRVKFNAVQGMLKGLTDTISNWWLVIRCSALGTLLGAIPGITGSVVDWIAYGHAIRSVKGADKTFSTGDVRGVIAPESANNSYNGGSLLPTIAFGVPASASQAVLLGAIMVHGFIPGPAMLTENLDVTFTMVWSIALANIVGAGLCFVLSGQLAKISTMRYTLLLPVMMAIVYVGAFQGSRSWGDMYVLLFFGAFAWTMKQLKWPRPPLILGLVLGVLIERYLAICIVRYEWSWLLRPGVVVLLGLAVLVLFRPLFNEIRNIGLKALLPERARPTFRSPDLIYVGFLGLAIYMVLQAQAWPFNARIGPTVVGSTLIIACTISFIYVVFADRRPEANKARTAHRGIHMDLNVQSDEKLTPRQIILRAGIFFGWFVAFLISMSIIGLIPTVPLTIIAYMRIEGREPWRYCLLSALVATLLVYLVFDQNIHVPWPRTLLGGWFPALGDFIPSI